MIRVLILAAVALTARANAVVAHVPSEAATPSPRIGYRKAVLPQIDYANLKGLPLLESLSREMAASHHLMDPDVWKALIPNFIDRRSIGGVKGLVDFYTGTFVPGDSLYLGDFRFPLNFDGLNKIDSLNCEHLLPVAIFKKGSSYARHDPHNLRVSCRRINGRRSTRPFRNSDKGTRLLADNIEFFEHQSFFKPPEHCRGEIARSFFGMAARFWFDDVFDQPKARRFFLSSLKSMLLWNRTFPPTPSEVVRNGLIFRAEGFSNPFVLDPRLVDAIGRKAFAQFLAGK